MRHAARRYGTWCATSGLLAALLQGSFIWAQATPPETAKPVAGADRPDEKKDSFQLPSDPTNWVNSPPLTNSALEGKGAVLWFYEEQCPKCREKWPSMMALSKKFDGQPVVFIAVNSGNPRPVVQTYLQQLRITWPGVVDPTRQLEQSAGVNEISLQNIYQARVLTPEGKLVPANWNDLEGAAQLALKGAAWKVDPTTIPDSLRSTWQAVELGNYTAAGAGIKRALASSRDEATKAAGTKLLAAVQPKIDSAIADAKASAEKGDKVGALKQYTEITQRFVGFELPPEVATKRKELAADPQIKAVQKAGRDLADARRLLERSQAPAIRKRAVTLLKQVMKNAAGTELAKQAEELLATLEGGVAAQ